MYLNTLCSRTGVDWLAFWVGGRQREGEGPWYWAATGQDFTDDARALWAPGEPTAPCSGVQHCLALFQEPAEDEPGREARDEAAAPQCLGQTEARQGQRHDSELGPRLLEPLAGGCVPDQVVAGDAHSYAHANAHAPRARARARKFSGVSSVAFPPRLT